MAQYISIHAPAEGATSESQTCMNPLIFQSTLPRRERRNAYNPYSFVKYFNPRSRGGSDDTVLAFPSMHSHFNPRSRGGSDPETVPLDIHKQHFNPRSRGGSDRFLSQRKVFV